MRNSQFNTFANYATYMIKCLLIMKTDLRVQKSKLAIENAFINLVEIEGFQNITVKEIAEKAVVNRNTIYLNYGSKEGILESIVKTSFERYFGELNHDVFRRVSINKKSVESFFRKLFLAINENIELYRILLTDNSSTGYLQMEARKLKKYTISVFKPTIENELKFSFFIAGVWGIVQNYIVYAKGTEEENIRILTDLALSNLRHISHAK